MASATWHGRRGPVLLGPTEHRVARALADLCRAGRVTIRMADLAPAVRVERSELYRITRRLRVLGLFGIENDRGGARGGRRIWRTAIEHDGATLDANRHRVAWSRLVAWSRARRARVSTRLAELRGHHRSASVTMAREGAAARMGPAVPPGPGTIPPGGAGPGFGERLLRAGLRADLAERFGLA